MRNYEKARTKNLVKEIHALFNGKRRILAAEALSHIKGSNVTIQKAKYKLGIKSKRIAGRFYWMAPKCTAEEALRLEEKEVWASCPNEKCNLHNLILHTPAHKLICFICRTRMKVSRYRPYQKQGFERMMRMRGYCVPQNKALPVLMRTLHASRTEVFALKKALGVTTFKDTDGKYYWIQLAPVVEWLGSRITAQPTPVTELQQAAEKDHIPWHLVITARHMLHNIKITPTGDHWYDNING